MKKEKLIKIKYDKTSREYVLLSKSGSLDTKYSHVTERKQCSTCEHLRKSKIIKEDLFEETSKDEVVPLGVCTLGIMWRVVIPKKSQDLVSCARLTMNIKDTYA